MKPSVRHIAKTGASKGQWVNCSARINCRNSNSVHVNTDDLYRARDLILEKTGKHYPAIARIPVDEVKSVLTSGEVRPNGLPQKQTGSVATPYKVVPPTPKKNFIPKIFNEGSSFVEILNSVYGKNDYSPQYPFNRIVTFDKLTAAEFKEARDYLYDRSKAYGYRGFPWEHSGLTLKVTIRDERDFKNWAPVEVHSLLSWIKFDTIKKYKNTDVEDGSEELSYADQKHEFLEYVKSLGINAVID